MTSVTFPVCLCKTPPCTCQDEHNTFEWTWDDTDLNSSTVISENKHDILFHKTFSTGTAAVRGSEPFALNYHYYWEIRIITTLYGTDVMIGIGTDAVDLNFLRNRFCRMLGIDGNSWGYSYRSEVQHDGKFYKYGTCFDKGSVIGCHLDMCQGTLEYYHNRKRLGVAFTGLKLYARRLYPIVCSTAAQSALRLSCALVIKPTLQLATLQNIKKHKEIQAVVDAAPPGLRRQLQQQYWWLIESPADTNETIKSFNICSSDEEVMSCDVQSRRTKRRKRKRSKKSNSNTSAVQQSRLTDGPTSVETLKVDRVLRSHTKSTRINALDAAPSRAGPRTRRQTSSLYP